MALARVVVLLLRFLSELAALAGFCLVGFQANVFAGIAAPVAAGVFWGRFVAPQSSRRLEDPKRLWAEVLFFGLATIAWTHVANGPIGIAYGVAAIAVALLTRVVGEPAEARPVGFEPTASASGGQRSIH